MYHSTNYIGDVSTGLCISGMRNVHRGAEALFVRQTTPRPVGTATRRSYAYFLLCGTLNVAQRPPPVKRKAKKAPRRARGSPAKGFICGSDSGYSAGSAAGSGCSADSAADCSAGSCSAYGSSVREIPCPNSPLFRIATSSHRLVCTPHGFFMRGENRARFDASSCFPAREVLYCICQDLLFRKPIRTLEDLHAGYHRN